MKQWISVAVLLSVLLTCHVHLSAQELTALDILQKSDAASGFAPPANPAMNTGASS